MPANAEAVSGLLKLTMVNKLKLRRRKLALVMLILIALYLLVELLLRPQVLLQSLASAFYGWNNYPAAERIFAHNAKKDKGIAQANLAKSLYRQNEYSQADSASAVAAEKLAQPDIFYDQGNSLYRQNKFEEALKSYKKAILNAPKDLDAKANYELTLRKLQKLPTPPPQENQQDKQEKRKQEEIKNILDGLDNKESSDRKQNQKSLSPSETQWW